jgi:hypothetical protein
MRGTDCKTVMASHYWEAFFDIAKIFPETPENLLLEQIQIQFPGK